MRLNARYANEILLHFYVEFAAANVAQCVIAWRSLCLLEIGVFKYVY